MGISTTEAAAILGVSTNRVHQLVSRGRLDRTPPYARDALDRDQVEQLSLELLTPGQPHPYWATAPEAALILGVTDTRVRQLARRGRIPAVQHDGRWHFRRQQLEVVANARDARRRGVGDHARVSS